MEFIVKLKLSRDYMSESYDQARRYGTKWLLVEWIIGISFILIGLAFYFYLESTEIFPLALVIIGIFELLSNYIKKYFWLRRHAKSKLIDAEVELKVTEIGIDSRGPYSEGIFRWEGVEKFVRTPRGILLWPQKGMYWYLPDNIAGVQTIEFIQSKIA